MAARVCGLCVCVTKWSVLAFDFGKEKERERESKRALNRRDTNCSPDLLVGDGGGGGN